MNNPADANKVKAMLEEYGFTFSKGLGQNFLTDAEVCPRMARCAQLDAQTGVIEIGAGAGVLTAELCRAAGKVVTFEVDKRLLPVLARTLEGFNNVTVINADILKIDLKELIEREFKGMRVCVCANLPYYITSQIIMLLLESRLPIDTVTVMVQAEAAQRLCAHTGERDGGAITAAVNYYSEPERMFFVDRSCFMPSPKVDSEVIRLKVRKEPAVAVKDEKAMFRVIKAAFAQRRKTAVNSISGSLGVPKASVAQVLDALGLDPSVRAERLTLKNFADISAALGEG